MSDKIIITLRGPSGESARRITIDLPDMPEGFKIQDEAVVIDFMDTHPQDPILLVRGIQVNGVHTDD
jgi:hypothetical protein